MHSLTRQSTLLYTTAAVRYSTRNTGNFGEVEYGKLSMLQYAIAQEIYSTHTLAYYSGKSE
jgi:hypothetical protein